MASPASRNFAFIHALRGFAALVVVFFHFIIHVVYRYEETPIPQDTVAYWLVYGRFDLGKYAVAVFFLVSGFLIPATLASPNATLKRYAIHRLFRLYPAYWLSILAYIGHNALTGHAHFLKPKEILINVTMLQKFVGVKDVIGVFWTLQIELVFYILCAVLFALRKLEARLPILIGATLLAVCSGVARFALNKPVPVALFLALVFMFLGAILRAEDPPAVRRPAFAITLIGLVITCYFGYRDEWVRYVLAYALGLLTFLGAMRANAWFETKSRLQDVLRYLGDISYSVYLLHSPIGLTLGHITLKQTGNPWIAALACFSSTLISSALSYRFVEAPGIAMGRRLTPR